MIVKEMLCAVVLAGMGFFGIAAADPTPEQLQQAADALSNARSMIAAGQVAEGLQKMNSVQAVAQSSFPDQWQFLTKLADAVTAEKASKVDDAKALLAALCPQCKDTNQIAALETVSARICQALVKADKKSSAADLVATIESGPAAASTDFNVSDRVSRLWLGVDDSAKAEAAIKRSAPLAAATADWTAWGNSANALLGRFVATDDKVAAYRRFAALATTDASKAGKEVMGSSLVLLANNLIRSGKTDEGNKILQAVKDTTGGGSASLARAQALDKVIQAKGLVQANDLPGALKALQEGYAVIKDLTGADSESASIYQQGCSVAQAAVRTGDKATAGQTVDFLMNGLLPKGTSGGYLTMAGYLQGIGDTQKMEDTILKAAPLVKLPAEKSYWVYWVWVGDASLRKTPDEMIAVYDRFADAAKANGTAEDILKNYFSLVRQKASQGSDQNVAQARALLDALKTRAAAMPGLAGEMQRTTLLVTTDALNKAGNQAEVLKALQDILELSKGDAPAMDTLYRRASGLAWQWATDAKGSAEELMKFLAKPEMRAASGKKTEQEQWTAWATQASRLIWTAPSTTEMLATYDRLAPAMESPVAKEAMLRTMISDMRGKLSADYEGKYAEQAPAFLAAIKERAAGIDGLSPDIRQVDALVTTQALNKAGNHADVLKVFEQSYATDRANPSVMAVLYSRGDFFLRNWVGAKDRVSAEGMLKFLARKEVRDGSGKKAPEEQWAAWGSSAASVVKLAPTAEEMIATYDRLAPLMELPVAKEVVLKAMVAEAKSRLGSGYEGTAAEQAVALLGAVRDRAAGIASVAGDVQILQSLIATQALTKAGNFADAVKSLEGVLAAAKGNASMMDALYKRANDLLAQWTKSGQDAAAEGLVAFLLKDEMLQMAGSGRAQQETSLKVTGQTLAAKRLFKANDQNGALAALQGAYALVKDMPAGSAEVSNVYRLGTEFATALVKAGDKASAQRLLDFLVAGPVAKMNTDAAYIAVFNCRQSLGDAAGAEAALLKAGPLVKDATGKTYWSTLVSQVIDRQTTVDGMVGVYDRFADVAKANGTAETFLKKFFALARQKISQGGDQNVAQAQALLEALKTRAAAMPALAQEMQRTTLMATTETLNKAGNQAEAVKTLQDMLELSKGDAEAMQSLYRRAASLVEQWATKARGPAEELVKFMAGQSMREGSGEKTADGQWKSWAASACRVIASAPTAAETVATYDRLAPLMTSQVAKEAVLRSMVVDLRSKLGGDWGGKFADDAPTLLAAIKDRSAGIASLGPDIQQVDSVVATQPLNKAGNRADVLRILDEAYKASKTDRSMMTVLHTRGAYFLREWVTAKDRASAEQMVTFLARKEVREAPAARTADEAWTDWAALAVSVVKLAPTADEMVATYDRLAPLMETAVSKEAVLKAMLAEARTKLTAAYEGPTLDQAVTLIGAVKQRAAGIASLAGDIGFLESLAATQALTKAGNFSDALKTLNAVLVAAKGDPTMLDALHKRAKLLLAEWTKSGQDASAEQLVAFLLKDEMLQTAGAGRAQEELSLKATAGTLAAKRLFKANDPNGALTALQAAFAAAKGLSIGGTEFSGVYRLACDSVPALLKAGDAASAKKVADFLAEGPVATMNTAGGYMTLSGLRQSMGDAAGAESALLKAGPLVKETEKAGWALSVSLMIGRQTAVDGMMGVYDRFADAAKTNGTAEGILKSLITRARTKIGSEGAQNVAEALALYDALKTRTTGMTGLTGQMQVLASLVATETLSKAGNNAQALQVLQDLTAAAKDDPATLTAIRDRAMRLLAQWTTPQTRGPAEELVKFLAKKEMREASLAGTADDQWKSWAASAWSVIRLAPKVDDLIAAYDRLAPVMESSVAKEAVLRYMLGDVQARLVGNYDGKTVDQSVALFTALKDRATDIAGLSNDIDLVQLMVSTDALNKSGSYADVLTALDNAYKAGKTNPALMSTLAKRGEYLLRLWLKAKAKDPSEQLAKMLARPELRAAAEPLKSDADRWKAWSVKAWPVIALGANPAECLAAYGRLCDGADASVKEPFLDRFVSMAQSDLSLGWQVPHKADGLSLYASIKPMAAGLPGLADRIAITDQMVTVHAMNDAANYDGAVSALQAAFKRSKGRQQDVASLYDLSSYVVENQQRSKLAVVDHTRDITRLLAGMLRKALADIGPDGQTDYLLTLYVKSAVVSGLGNDAMDVLSTYKATPGNYLALAAAYRDFGNLDMARKALAAIPDSEIKKDATLANGIANFWPAPVKKAMEQVARTKALMDVYQRRQAEAKAAGANDKAQAYAAALTELQDQLTQQENDVATLSQQPK